MGKYICKLCNNYNIRPYYKISRLYAGNQYELSLLKCSNCGFIFLENQPEIAYNQEYVENTFSTDENVLHEYRLFHAQQRLSRIAKYVKPSRKVNFLDIGIGDGLILSQAEELGYQTFGLDINPSSVELARERYNVKADIRLGEPNLFNNKQFNVIHMNETIEHISNPIALFKWCRDHLTAGILVIQTGNIDSLVSKIKRANWDYFIPPHIGYFSGKTMSMALKQTGFSVINLNTIDWQMRNSMNHFRLLLNNCRIFEGVNFLLLYITSLIYGIRRSLLIYAR
jgi:cyclopropane fatty-acyl-phospholipid synthase-like methyltransferase